MDERSAACPHAAGPVPRARILGHSTGQRRADLPLRQNTSVGSGIEYNVFSDGLGELCAREAMPIRGSAGMYTSDGFYRTDDMVRELQLESYFYYWSGDRIKDVIKPWWRRDQRSVQHGPTGSTCASDSSHEHRQGSEGPSSRVSTIEPSGWLQRTLRK